MAPWGGQLAKSNNEDQTHEDGPIQWCGCSLTVPSLTIPHDINVSI